MLWVFLSVWISLGSATSLATLSSPLGLFPRIRRALQTNDFAEISWHFRNDHLSFLALVHENLESGTLQNETLAWIFTHWDKLLPPQQLAWGGSDLRRHHLRRDWVSYPAETILKSKALNEVTRRSLRTATWFTSFMRFENHLRPEALSTVSFDLARQLGLVSENADPTFSHRDLAIEIARQDPYFFDQVFFRSAVYLNAPVDFLEEKSHHLGAGFEGQLPFFVHAIQGRRPFPPAIHSLYLLTKDPYLGEKAAVTYRDIVLLAIKMGKLQIAWELLRDFRKEPWRTDHRKLILDAIMPQIEKFPPNARIKIETWFRRIKR